MNKLLIFDYSDTLISNTNTEVISTELLKRLKAKGYKLAILTNAYRSDLENYLSLNKGLFDMVVTQDDYEPKPSVDGIMAIVTKLRPDKAIFIGDSQTDYETALKASVPFMTPDAFVLTFN